MFQKCLALTLLKTSCMTQPRLEYLHRKGVYWTIEQPASSILPYLPDLEATWPKKGSGFVIRSVHVGTKSLCKRHGARFISLPLGAVGHQTVYLGKLVL